MDPDDVAAVQGLLALAGLPASAHEAEVIARTYKRTRDQIAVLWSLPEARNAEPALIFQAEPAPVFAAERARDPVDPA